jgi:inositol hexakisphosphate/diphosphoinositol-pentakisphosphate kinase
MFLSHQLLSHTSAEARKSPTVDGKVERNSDGKEVRFPVILTYREKEIARRIVLVFGQLVCGFDILRVQEGHNVVSYVCDVNGWSFVKNSRKYYDDCSLILSEHILAMVKPAALQAFSTLDPMLTTSLKRLDDEMMEGDGGSVAPPAPAPAATMNKFLSRAARLLQGDSGGEESDLDDDNKTVATLNEADAMSQHSHPDANLTNLTTLSPGRSELVEPPPPSMAPAAATLVDGALPVREFPNNLTSEPASLVQSSNSSAVEELDPPRRKRSSSIQQSHQEELRCVIAIIRHGDRTPKQKLKVNMSQPLILDYFHKQSEDCTKDLKVKGKAPLTAFLATVKKILVETKNDESAENVRYQLMHMRDILERWKIVGLNRKLQIKPRKMEEVVDETTGESSQRCSEVQLILKWGGNLTKLGEKQAIQLGHRHRHDLYPDASGGGKSAQGSGYQKALHATSHPLLLYRYFTTSFNISS